MPTTEQTAEGVAVVVYGPNLWHQPGDSPETFHVHRPGCADLRRRAIYRRGSTAEGPWTITVASRLNLIADIYDPASFEYDLEDAVARAAYETDIRIFPCVTGLA